MKLAAAEVPRRVLPILVFSQFGGNAVLDDLQEAMNLAESAVGSITSAVQLGFIVGTFVFAFLSIADRFSPSKVFLISAIFGALFNSSIPPLRNDILHLLE